MAIISEEDTKLMKEICADPVAKSLLQGKCKWEHMSMYAVLHEWGDPRKWHNGKIYKEAKHIPLSQEEAISSCLSDKCKNCGRPRGDHLAKTYACPSGKKARVIGHTSYSLNQFFEKASEKIVKKRTAKKRVPACPHCGDGYGYYQLSRVSGYARLTFNWDGSPGDSTDMHDGITYKDLKTLRCCHCNAIIHFPKKG